MPEPEPVDEPEPVVDDPVEPDPVVEPELVVPGAPGKALDDPVVRLESLSMLLPALPVPEAPEVPLLPLVLEPVPRLLEPLPLEVESVLLPEELGNVLDDPPDVPLPVSELLPMPLEVPELPLLRLPLEPEPLELLPRPLPPELEPLVALSVLDPYPLLLPEVDEGLVEEPVSDDVPVAPLVVPEVVLPLLVLVSLPADGRVVLVVLPLWAKAMPAAPIMDTRTASRSFFMVSPC